MSLNTLNQKSFYPKLTFETLEICSVEGLIDPRSRMGTDLKGVRA